MTTGINDPAVTKTSFEALIAKPKSLLTKEERKVIALGKGVQEAQRVIFKIKEAIAQQEERMEAAKESLDKAIAEYKTAQEELDATKKESE